MRSLLRGTLSTIGFVACLPAHAWFIIFPIPNFAKPPQIQKNIDALESSTETKAVAYASEDKTFGSKQWVYGQFSGHVSQETADRRALAQCRDGLARAKGQTAGGKPIFDFGKKECELHSFQNKTVSPQYEEQLRTAADAVLTLPDAKALLALPRAFATPAAFMLPAVAAQEPQAATVQTEPDSGTPPATNSPPESVPTPPSAARPPELATQAASAQAPSRLSDTAPALSGMKTLPAAPRVTALSPTAAAKPQESTTPATATAQSPKPTGTESPVAKRLRELNELRREGLISEAEFNDKRKAILSTL